MKIRQGTLIVASAMASLMAAFAPRAAATNGSEQAKADSGEIFWEANPSGSVVSGTSVYASLRSAASATKGLQKSSMKEAASRSETAALARALHETRGTLVPNPCYPGAGFDAATCKAIEAGISRDLAGAGLNGAVAIGAFSALGSLLAVFMIANATAGAVSGLAAIGLPISVTALGCVIGYKSFKYFVGKDIAQKMSQPTLKKEDAESFIKPDIQWLLQRLM